MSEPAVLITYDGPIAILTLARPERRNALDAAMISELTAYFTALASDERVQAVVLSGSGKAFCAGADLNWMRESLQWSHEQNIADAEALAALFDAAWSLPKPLVGRINGAAVGGGAGLVACCDLAVTTIDARFSFAEVKLGLVPAVIAQFVVPKIGVSHARALFISGEQITAERAFEIGLVHAITTDQDLDVTVSTLVRRMLGSAPEAVASAKRIVDAVWTMERADARRFVVEAIASARIGAEGQEGVTAFLEKRSPRWVK